MSSNATTTAGPTRSSGKCVSVPYLGKERLPNGVKSYPAREIDGLDFRIPGDPALAESRLPQTPRGLAAQGLQDPPAEPRGGMPLHLHARESVRHESSVHASQADGLDPRQLPRAQARRGLGTGRVQLQPHGRQAVHGRAGDRRSHAQAHRGEEGFLRSHAHPHRLSDPEPEGLGGTRHPGHRRSGAGSVARATRRSMRSNGPIAPTATSRSRNPSCPS